MDLWNIINVYVCMECMYVHLMMELTELHILSSHHDSLLVLYHTVF
jgi:hypothetical protein